MPVKTEITSFSQTTDLHAAATARGIGDATTVRLGYSAYESANVRFSVVEPTEEGNYLVLFSNGETDERGPEQMAEARIFSPRSLNWLIGTRLAYDEFTHTKSGNTWTTVIGAGGQTYQGSDQNEANALAEAIIAYLNGGGPIV